MGYVSKAFNPIVNNPTNSADNEAAKLLRQHQGNGIKGSPARSTSGSGSTKPRQATGTKQGSTRLRGGKS